MNLWSQVDMKVGDTYCWHLGLTMLWLTRTTKEWKLSIDRSPIELAPDASPIMTDLEPPKNLEWERWSMKVDSGKVRLRPLMPDRPLVVRPEHKLNVMPDTECAFFVSVWSWVTVELGLKGDYRLGEYPTMILSSTWFGDSMEGEPCYSVKTTARRELDDMPKRINRVICPVVIENESSEVLSIDRLCLHGEHLFIFEGDNCLWATETKLSYLGDSRFSRVVYTEGSPAIAGKVADITSPRLPPDQGVIRRSFMNLRHLAEMQIWPT